MRKTKNLLLLLLVCAVYLLHQDFWNWKKASVIFGFLPIGLAYQAGYSFLAALTMAILVKFAWPSHLENVQPENEAAATRQEGLMEKSEIRNPKSE